MTSYTKSRHVTIAEHIEQDLAERVRAKAGPRRVTDEQLTLVALAREYSVSTTPVRHAIAGLLQRGVLKRKPDGRLGVARASSKPAGSGTRRARSRESARPLHDASAELTEAVERHVLQLSMRGDAAFVREQAFAERLDVGRTRLRRVLHELAGAGVVEHVERRGFRTRPFQRADMLAFLDVRATLECRALDLARAQLDGSVLAAVAVGNGAAAVAAGHIDNGLHAHIVECANNQYLAAFFASHGRYYARLFDFAAEDTDRLGEMADQHTEILAHIAQRRWARCRRALRHHIHSQGPVLAQAIERLQHSPIDDSTTSAND
ncbi:MAG: FCD domain-containing protein [Planctomycetota bacterium]